MTAADAALLLVAAFGGGALNAVAGGGSLITFPTLLLQGVPPVSANASSTVALWPGSLASVGAYRHNLGDARRHLPGFAAVSLAGGLLGAQLLLRTSGATFRALVPWLLLLATVVFAFGRGAIARIRRGRAPAVRSTAGARVGGLLAQLLIATYGGYFGGGMGIMMLAAFAALGMEDIHAMNGLKNLCAVCINGVAVVTFVVAGVVSWPHTLVMLAGAVAGGYAGAAGARRLDPEHVRGFVIALGAVLTAYFFVRA